MKHPTLIPLVAALCWMCASAQAADPIGFYLGAAVGQSEQHVDPSLTGTTFPNDVNAHDTGWKAMIGIRPLSIVGAELDYLDFGSARYSLGTVDSKAWALYGLVYAPIPVPYLDIFGKVGAGRVQTDANGYDMGVFCPAQTPNCGVIASSYTDTGLAYGAGVQFKFSKAAIRAEYERIDTSKSSPGMFSLGVTWTP
jgi:OmpA-OmpF porin, OOP family